ncbi:MAG: hypothetical protein HZC36_05555 [Armatimonadetes bacterium]|nr:hypothetical protein [Armatimonadota bacterium]
MKTKHLSFLFAMFAFLVVGCGGASMGMDDALRSSFEGQWVGTYDSQSGGANGTLNLAIDAGGRVAGTMHDDVASNDATVSGVVASDGGMNVEARFPDQLTCSLSGLMMLNQAGHTSGCHELGHMVGNVILHMGPGNYETVVHLTPRKQRSDQEARFIVTAYHHWMKCRDIERPCQEEVA